METLPKDIQRKIMYYYLEHPVAKLFKNFVYEDIGYQKPVNADTFVEYAIDYITYKRGKLFCEYCECLIINDDYARYEIENYEFGKILVCMDCLNEIIRIEEGDDSDDDTEE